MGNRADGISMDGFDKAVNMLEGMIIDDFKETELLKKCKPITEEIKANQTVLTGSQYEGWHDSVKKIDGNKNFVISNDDFSWIFENYGTSISKHNIGYADRAIDSKMEEVKEAMVEFIEEQIK